MSLQDPRLRDLYDLKVRSNTHLMILSLMSPLGVCAMRLRSDVGSPNRKRREGTGKKC